MSSTKRSSILVFLFFSITLSAQYKQYSGDINSTTSSSECYCHFEYDYTNLLNAWNQLIESQRQAWLNAREQEFKEEIEQRLNKTFPSFDSAQKEFFEQRFAPMTTDPILENKVEYYDKEIEEVKLDFDMTFSRYKAVELRYTDLVNNTQNYNFGDIEYYGQRIVDHPLHYISSSMYNRHDQYWENLNTLDYLIYRQDKFDQVLQEKKFEEYIANLYIQHYGNHGLEDKVELMAKYLIIDNIRFPYAFPSGGPEIYNTNGNQFHYELENIISSASVPDNYYPEEPIFSTAEIIERFAISSLDPFESGPTTKSDFVFSDESMTENFGEYLSYHNFSSSSLNLSKRLLQNHLDGNNFTNPSSWYQTTSIGRQTEDREDIVYTNLLSSVGNQNDFKGFGKVLNFYFNFTKNYAMEGALIREIILANSGYSLPSELSDFDLGKLFNFENSINIQLRFSSDLNFGKLYHRDNEYGWDLFEDPFKIAALDEMARGGYADFYDEIIFTKEFLESKGVCIYQHIENISPGLFESTIRNFCNNENYDLILTTYNNPNDVADARTDGSKISDGIVTIKINLARQSSNSIEWAATLIHEGIHAEMYRFIEADDPGVFSDDRARITELYLQFKETEWGNDSSVQHYRMSEEYIVPIAEALRLIDNKQFPVDHYMYFAWDGVIDYAPDIYKPSNAEMLDWENKAVIVRQNQSIPCTN